MESRKLVLMNVLQGSNGKKDIENRLMDMGRGEQRVRCMERVTWKLILRKTDSQREFAIQQIVSGNRKRGSAST